MILACMPLLQSVKSRCIEAPMNVFRVQKTLDRLEDRLARVETLCSDLQRESRKLELEFTDLYDKVRHQMSRMAKRDAASRKENGPTPPEEPVDDEYRHTDTISASILRRRGMLRQAE